VLLALGLALATAWPAPAGAEANAEDSLIYMPYGLIHSLRPASEVDGYLTEVAPYGIGQLIFATPKSPRRGSSKCPRVNRQMLQLWSSRAAAYDAAHGTSLSVTLVVPAKVKGSTGGGIDLESAAVRAQIVAGIEAALGLGIAGVQLDFEPYRRAPATSRCCKHSTRCSCASAFTGALPWRRRRTRRAGRRPI